MNYQEIYDNVVSLTNHPEMAAETATVIKAATLRLHQSDYYERDVEESKIVLEQADYIHQFNAEETLVRFRHIKWLRKWDPSGTDPLTQLPTGVAGDFFKILDPENILDGYSVTKPNTAYLGGSNLNIRSSTQIQWLLMAWYKNPLVVDANNYDSWIARQVPFAIIFDAVSMLFQMLQQQEQSRKFDALVAEQLAMVKMIGLAPKGS